MTDSPILSGKGYFELLEYHKDRNLTKTYMRYVRLFAETNFNIERGQKCATLSNPVGRHPGVA